MEGDCEMILHSKLVGTSVPARFEDAGRVTKEHGLISTDRPRFGPQLVEATWREGINSALVHVSITHSAFPFLSACSAAKCQLASFRYPWVLPWIRERRNYPFKPLYSVHSSRVSSGVKQAVSLTVSSTRRLTRH